MKIEIANIETDVKTLKQYRSELKECKEVMLSVAEGTEEWNAALKRSAEIQHNFNEVNEAVRLSARDFGQIASNVTNTLAGFAGGVTAVTGVLQLMGVEDTKVAEKTTALMASLIGITEGLSKLDTGLKAATTLYKHFKNSTLAATIQNWLFNKSVDGGSKALNKFKLALVSTGVGALVVALGFAISKFTEFITANDEAADSATNNINEVTDITKQSAEQVSNASKATADLILKNIQKQKDELKSLVLSGKLSLDDYNNKLVELDKKGYKQIISSLEARLELYEDDSATRKQLEDDINTYKNKLYDIDLNNFKKSEEERKRIAEQYAKDNANAIKTEREIQLKILKEQDASAHQESESALETNLRNIEREYDKHFRKLNFDRGKDRIDQKEYDRQENKALWNKYKEQKAVVKQYIDDTNVQIGETEQKITEYTELLNNAKTKGDIEFYTTRISDLNTLLGILNSDLKKGEDQLNSLMNQNQERFKAYHTTYRDIYKDILNNATSIIDDERKTEHEKIQEWYNQDLAELKRQLDLKLISQEEYDKAVEQLTEARKVREIQAEREITAKKVEVMNMSLSHTKDILSSISSEMDSNNREQFEANKGMQIATAQIDILQGVITALSGLWTTKTGPWDIALAAAQAGMITTAGMINIAKISRTKYKGSNSSSPTAGYSNTASINSNAMSEASTSSNTLQNIATATEGFIKDTRVYVVESDITNTQNKVNVVESNSKF